MTKLCIKILVESDSAIESVFPWGKYGSFDYISISRDLDAKNRCREIHSSGFSIFISTA